MSPNPAKGMPSATVRERQIHNLTSDLAVLHAYLTDDSVSDIFINPDGKLWVRVAKEGRKFTGVVVPSEVTRRIILSTASLLQKTVDAENPVLEGVLPEYGCRIHAFIEPWVLAPSLCVRKPTTKVFTLLDYVQSERLSPAYNDALYDAIVNRKNIVIGGGTGTGKTTFLNALINECAIHRPKDRFFIVEDTPEIRCTAEDYASLVVRPTQTIEAVRGALRYNPDRIVFGELRHGEAALELLKAMNTGHEGSFTTIHCNSAALILPRLVSLISESIVGNINNDFIAETINLCVYMKDVPGFGPKIVDLLRVESSTTDGRFVYHHIKERV